MRPINWPYLIAFGQKIEKRLNLTVFENFMKWGAPITDFSKSIFGLPRRYYNHFWAFYAWVSQKIHFLPKHAVPSVKHAKILLVIHKSKRLTEGLSKTWKLDFFSNLSYSTHI